MGNEQTKGTFEQTKKWERRPFNEMRTEELLDIIEKKIQRLLNIVKTTKQPNYRPEKRSYVVQVMHDAEVFLRTFLEEMGVPTAQTLHTLKEEISTLKKNYDREMKRNKELNEEIARLQKPSKPTMSQTVRVGNAQFYGQSTESIMFNVSEKQPFPTSKCFGKNAEQSDHSNTTSLQELQKEISAKEEKIKELHATNQSLKSYADTLKKQIAESRERNNELTKDYESLLNRLSKLAGKQLTEDNPAIVDLSDPNRPTKLGEVYSEIYDNEWTDAFDQLEKAGYSEEESIETLRLTLLNVVQFCQRKSAKLLEKTKEAVEILFEEYRESQNWEHAKHLTMHRAMSDQWGKIVRERDEAAGFILQRKWMRKDGKPEQIDSRKSIMVKTPDLVTNQLKIFRKEVAESLVPLVQKAYMSASWSRDECISGLKPYINKCLFLGWMMVVQSPPLVLATCNQGDTFNKDMYKDYTKSGPTVQYAVWPALLLHEGGPVIGKGVAQCQNLS